MLSIYIASGHLGFQIHTKYVNFLRDYLEVTIMIPYGENVLSIFSDTTESIKSMNIVLYDVFGVVYGDQK
jgi:hypothetical protein